ncbi:DUF7539 family protein [Halorubrum lacusprofundi]|jgi:hypothetical protein|uniref:Uncharacterized protein n=1 Tax=Halorubrum lacusprofundi (strain ATCC 49239 / DSM 5036 / JCM 8891 / ACAM 34) TaxID=416348 RepID=B9LX64_HALLT|nr:hypothetical protein [Halorubrum lacusprofundi]ACM59055.1 hypothetical protein Hlac_3548 [Halorubrum lacusprofundi ATCC 49239]MCG1007863.1 hypothetical protein [Halorubrum lacusprofundi]
MAELPDERQLVLGARSQLDRWTKSARREAYVELFDGDDPVLSPEEMQLLDALDSELERQGGDGVWGTDQYGIHTTGTSSSNTSLGVVCVYHPQITTDSVLRGGDDLDDETEERLNAALWKYSEHVATLIETQLNEFVHQN